jgi:branched-chain amino acid transport system substrate-binding protein
MFQKSLKLFFIATIIASFVLSGCAAPAPQVMVVTATPEAAKKVALPASIMVGVVQPLTGTFAVFGQDGKAGAEFAIADINAMGGIKSMGGLKLTMAVEDAGDKPDTAKLATESMISKNHPVAILGEYISRFVMAASEVTDREKVILLADALVPQVTEMGRQYLFRPGPTASNHGAMAYHFIRDTAKAKGIDVKTMAVLNEDSANGRANTLGATEAALMDKFPVVTSIEYPYDITDATQIVQQLKKVNPDFVIHTPYFNDAIVFGKAFQEVGYTPKFVGGAGGCGYADADSIKALGAFDNGMTMTYSYDPYKNTPQNKKFVDEFKAKYGKLPSEGAGMNYYDAMTLYEALEYSGKNFPNDPLNPDNLRASFMALDLKTGPAAETIPSGEIKFDGKGDNMYPSVVVMQVQNGVPVTVYPNDVKVADPIFPNPNSQQ